MRLIASVLAGFLTTVVLALGTDLVLRMVLPNMNESSLGLQIATLIYTSLFAGAGGFVTARIARTQPMRAVFILVMIAFCISLATLASEGSQLPAWYKIASMALLIPFTLAGGWLGTRRAVQFQNCPPFQN